MTILKIALFCLLLLPFEGHCQSPQIEAKEIEVYRYLFHQATVNCDSTRAKGFKDGYCIKTGRSTSNKYLFPDFEEQNPAYRDLWKSFRTVNFKNHHLKRKNITDSNCHGKKIKYYLEFSRVAFNLDNSAALVYMGESYGGLDGVGNIILLKKEAGDSQWKVIKKYSVWIS
jgi:hypothetical protein